MASTRSWLLLVVAVGAVLAVARVVAERDGVVAAIEQERRDAGPVSSVDQQMAAAQLPALIQHCRRAARAKVWPDKVGRFDYGHEPEGAVMFMSPRQDGVPVIEFDTTFPTAAGFAPVTPPVRGRVGVRGRFEHESRFGGGPSAADAYFCAIDVDGMRFDVRQVSIEVVH